MSIPGSLDALPAHIQRQVSSSTNSPSPSEGPPSASMSTTNSTNSTPATSSPLITDSGPLIASQVEEPTPEIESSSSLQNQVVATSPQTSFTAIAGVSSIPSTSNAEQALNQSNRAAAATATSPTPSQSRTLSLSNIGSSSSTAPLPVPVPVPVPVPSNAPAPGSPSGSSTNRFGLALGFMGRRPRGFTNPSSMSPGGSKSPGATGRTSGGVSPANELPPSPGTAERTGYGFPALRRTLSKRANSSSNNNNSSSSSNQLGLTGVSSSATILPEGSRASTGSRRSSSQPAPRPPVPASSSSNPLITSSTVTQTGSEMAETGSLSRRSRPRTATEAVMPPSISSQPSLQPLGPTATTSATAPTTEISPTTTHRFRLVPHLESSRSLHFEPIDRDLAPFTILRVGRFTDRSHPTTNADPLRIAFKSKVVSRGHAEIWADETGKFFIKDTKSSSGTFLNHIRLSGPNSESRPFALKDGDILQLGVDYQGGTEEIYRCVKMKVELNRGWQRGVNSFNTAALAQLRALGGGSTAEGAIPSAATSKGAAASGSSTPAAGGAAAASVTDCCICLYPVTVCQALFIAPCSHVTHFKCIRPLVLQNYPGFSCPLCRTYADLEADVEIEIEEPEPETIISTAAPVTGAVSSPSVVDDVQEEEEEIQDQVLISSEAVNSGDEDDDDEPHGAVVSSSTNGTESGNARSHIGTSGVSSDPNHIAIAPSGSSAVPMALNEANTEDDSVYASLANAATPPNSTFLSTLADRGAAFLPRFRAPVASLDMALFASQAQAGPSDPSRSSLGSDTDDARGQDDASTPELTTSLETAKRRSRDVDGEAVESVEA